MSTINRFGPENRPPGSPVKPRLKYRIHKIPVTGEWGLCEHFPGSEWCEKIYGEYDSFEGALNAYLGQIS